MSKIRVLLVDDSLTVRRRLADALQAEPDMELVGEAEDGKGAIERCLALRPDVVAMDMMMPVMTGVAATEYIMAHCPTPILIVSASTNRGELFRTYDALSAGAVDVLEKPRGDEPDGEWEGSFVRRVRLVSRIRVITHPRARLASMRAPERFAPIAEALAASSASNKRTAVAIGASTGGPGAIVNVLRALPEGFPLPVLFVLHISQPFAVAFADWLDAQTHMPVSYARHGESLAAAAGRVVMAPPDRHLIVSGGRLLLDDGPARHSCRPSVDVLFESLARELGSACGAVLLTGMGRDGAEGLLEIRRAGGLTIAQDEATSVVYGMPREAALLQAATKILPLQEIGPVVASFAERTLKP